MRFEPKTFLPLLLLAAPAAHGAGFAAFDTSADLPACDAAHGGSVAYVIADAGFKACDGAAWAAVDMAQPTRWNQANAERLRWDGGSALLTPATGRASLGLGSGALLGAGTGAGQALQLSSNAALPAIPAGAATGLGAALANGSVALASLGLGGCGNGDYLVTSGGAWTCGAAPGASGVLAPYEISGLTLAWTSTTSVTVAAGSATSDDGAEVVSLGSAQALDLTTTGANALDTGALAASTWYSIWLVKGSSGVATIASTSATAPTVPAGYADRKRRLGWIQTTATTTVAKFTAGDASRGRFFALEHANWTDLTATADTTMVTVNTFVPPGVRWVQAVAYSDTGANTNTYVYLGHASAPATAALWAVTFTNSIYADRDQVASDVELKIDTNGDRQINAWYTGNAAAGVKRVGITGWYDDLR